jgi:uncharacterized protein
MDMTGERRIPAPRKMVWDALNDPEILKTCIPGCDSLVAESPQDMRATASVRIGPISAKFNGKVHLSDIDEPNGYTISGEGQGGVAGFAKGGAQVHLAEEDISTTLLTYQVNAQVGGKMAQLGARLIDSTAKSMADTFFNRFTKELTEKMGPSPERAFPSAPSEAVLPVSSAAVPRPIRIRDMIPPKPLGYPLAAWIGVAIWICILFIIVAPLI